MECKTLLDYIDSLSVLDQNIRKTNKFMEVLRAYNTRKGMQINVKKKKNKSL